MAYTLSQFISNVKSSNAVKVTCRVSTAIYPVYIGIVAIILLGFCGCTPCLQKEPYFYNPKVEKCKVSPCTECIDITKIK